MKVYLIMNDEPLRPENMILVGKQSDAEKLIADGFGTYFEIIEVITSSSINEFYDSQEGRG